MQKKFNIHWDHYPSQRSELIYAQNRVGRKTLQYLEAYLRLNSIPFFAIINDLFHHLKDIFDNPHWIKHVMEKF